MGKYGDFPFQTPQVRPKSAIYTAKRDDEHTRHLLCHVVRYNRLDLMYTPLTKSNRKQY